MIPYKVFLYLREGGRTGPLSHFYSFYYLGMIGYGYFPGVGDAEQKHVLYQADR